MTWPMRALATAEALQRKHLLLIRWKGDEPGDRAPIIIDWDETNPTETGDRDRP